MLLAGILVSVFFVMICKESKTVRVELCNREKQSNVKCSYNGSKIDSFTIPPWLPKCNSVYMDLGSNIGVQVKKLYEPEKYPLVSQKYKRQKQMEVEQLYIEAFGTQSSHKNSTESVCALGFEPNPKHYRKLKHLEKAYDAKGWRVHFFPYAVSDENKFVTLYTENDSKKEDWGATIFKKNSIKGSISSYLVQSISLSHFINTYLKGIPIKLMKIDIEGAEFAVLTDLLFNELLCQRCIGTIYIEFHSLYDRNRASRLFFSKTDILMKIKSQTKCQPTKVLVLDDETYLHDIK